MAELLKIAGYSTIGLTIPAGLMKDRVRILNGIFSSAGIEVALRVDLAATSRMELLRLLRRLRNSYDIVAAKCVNPRVANVACRDRRVDVVFFDPRTHGVRFSHPLANLLRGSLEINLVSTLLTDVRREVLQFVRKQCSVAREHKVKIVLSSGISHPNMVRSPLQLAALARTLGLSETQSLNAVSLTPQSIIERNSIRRSEEFVEDGVQVASPGPV
jgi:RNase P/RNase MRP subunit p30